MSNSCFLFAKLFFGSLQTVFVPVCFRFSQLFHFGDMQGQVG